MYPNNSKREKSPNKKWNLEHRILLLLAPRFTDWANDNGPFDTSVLQNNIFKAMNVRNYLKRKTNPNEKWIQVRMSLENTTLALLAPRSTADWANGPLKTRKQ